MRDLKTRTDAFSINSKKAHGEKYDYSLVSYSDNRTKVNILCKKHGSFFQSPDKHTAGHGCPSCGMENGASKRSNKIKKMKEDFSQINPPAGSKIIPLTKGYYALVDEEDFDKVSKYIWNVRLSKHTNYAKASINGKSTFMHRFVMNVRDGKVKVDHIFHNGLDNRKEQLRVGSQVDNMMNSKPHKNSSSNFKGVTFDSVNFKWAASIMFKGKAFRLGRFKTEIEAAVARDKKAIELQGERAYLNFPNKP